MGSEGVNGGWNVVEMVVIVGWCRSVSGFGMAGLEEEKNISGWGRRKDGFMGENGGDCFWWGMGKHGLVVGESQEITTLRGRIAYHQVSFRRR